MKYQNCNLCGSDKYKPVHSEAGINVVQCLNCKFIYVNPMPNNGALLKEYDEKFFSKNDDILASSLNKRESVFLEALNTINKFYPSKGALLDMGCATGGFMAMAKNDGWDVQGVELSSGASEYCRTKLMLGVFTGMLQDAKFTDNAFDAVSMLDVLEHIPDVMGTLKEIRRVLKPGGIVVVRVPNVNFHMAKIKLLRLLKKDKVLNIFATLSPERHVNQFSPRTLGEFFKRAGFNKVVFSGPGAADLCYTPQEKRFLAFKIIYARAAKLMNFLSHMNFGNAILMVAKKE